MKRFVRVILVAIATWVLLGCEVTIPASNTKVSPSASPSDALRLPATEKVYAFGNLNTLTPRQFVFLSGCIQDSGVPEPVTVQFKDLFGGQRTLRMVFERIDSTTLSYAVNAVKDPTDEEPDPCVVVTMGTTNNRIKFSADGQPIAPIPSDLRLEITRPLTTDESAHGFTIPPHYVEDVSVDAWDITQSGLGGCSLRACIKPEHSGYPNCVLFGTKIVDLLGEIHRINLKAIHVTNDTWRITLVLEDSDIKRVDYKYGEGFLKDIVLEEPGKENYSVQVRFDLLSGRFFSGEKPTYRFYFGNNSTEVTLDLTSLTSVAGDNTAWVKPII